MKVFKSFLPFFIVFASINPAIAETITYIGEKGNYTVDDVALTYRGCTDAGCVNLGQKHFIASDRFGMTWINGDYSYQVSLKDEQIRIYKKTQLIFFDNISYSFRK